MQPEILRPAPLSVLVFLADAGVGITQILPALRPHFGLICMSPRQGVEAAREFQPDVVLIDQRASNLGALVGELTRAVGGRNLKFVAMPPTAGRVPVPPAGFDYCLPVPATAGEVEQLLWQIGRDLTRPPRSGPVGNEMIG